MIRVVLDTNILVSALLQPQGLPARTFLLTLSGRSAKLCVSGEIYAEYEEVIRRPKFNRSEQVIEQTLRAIRQHGFWVKPSARLYACSDPADNIFLECSEAARACYWQSEAFPGQLGRSSHCDRSGVSRHRLGDSPAVNAALPHSSPIAVDSFCIPHTADTLVR